MAISSKDIQAHLKKIGDSETAEILQRFFKTGKGQYGEGDIFLGIRVPMLRKLVKQYRNISITETTKLLRSKYHEQRLLALLLFVDKFSKSDEYDQKIIYQRYLDYTKYINNWDLVDLSAEHIIGGYLKDKDKSILYKLALSESLWERRIAMLSTFHFIKNRQFEDALKIAEILIDDKHDLIHKAVGWMLREIGKRDLETEEAFLKKQYKKMPRTMLRYAIEKFDEKKRLDYLNDRV